MLLTAQRCDRKFPTGRLECSESPDFLIHQDDRTRVGIEVTQLLDTCELAAKEALDKVIAEAKLRYGGPPVDVAVNFHPHLADYLRTLCRTIQRPETDLRLSPLPEQIVSRVKHTQRGPNEDLLGKGDLLSVRVNSALSEPTGKWWHPHVWFRHNNATERIEDIFRKKNQKWATYQKKANEVWLVIYHDAWRGPGELVVDLRAIRETEFASRFRRSLLVVRDARKIDALPLRHKSMEDGSVID